MKMKNKLKSFVLNIQGAFCLYTNSARIPTSELVNRIFTFCELYSGKTMFPYQEQFSKRVIRSVLENDGDEITALFSRQSGKSETVAVTTGGLMIILPVLANLPMFADDHRLNMFKDGIWVGIFAPSQRQAQITYNRIRSRIQSKTAQEVMNDPEFNLTFTTSNGQTVALSNGSFATAISASDGSNIEGESFKLIICEECFVKGTRVLTNDGYKNIEDIKVGDEVLSYNHTTGNLEIKTVTRVMRQPLYDRKLIRVTSEKGKSFVCTDNHPIFVKNKGYVRADRLVENDVILRLSDEDVVEDLVSVIEVLTYAVDEVFDLTVEDNHNFFAENILVHNCQDISNFKIQKCLTGDTRVLLESGEYKRLDEIVQDKKDKIVCFDKDMQYLTSKLPSEFYDNGIQDVYKITLDNGYSIKATDNHFFYTYSQKTNGDKLKFRSVKEIRNSLDKDRPLRVGIPDRLPYFAESHYLDYEKGEILGYFLGDGCTVSTPKFIGDIPTCNHLHDTIKKVVGEINMTEYHYNKDNGMLEVCFSTPTNKKDSNPLRRFLREYNLVDCTGEDKKLPDVLYSKEFYRGLISGLIETDGSIEQCTKKPIISFSNISKDLIDQVRDILLKFGIHSTVSVRDNTMGLSENSKPIWTIHIKSVQDINRFADEFVLFRKQVYLNEAVNTVSNKVRREKSKYYPDTMRFARVVSIEYAGKEHTYCLKVEGRNFIANNMISSNSIHPMGAAYNATIVKIGTATTFKGDFYDAIQRNKLMAEQKTTHIKNHFEYNWEVAAKYNPNYAKYVEKEKARLGENSDAFQMAYCVSPETRILTSDLRWVRADSIKVGDKLVGFDEDVPGRYGQRKFRESTVEDVGSIVRPCYKIHLSDGSSVTCSEEHQWLVFTAGSRTVWKQTKDLVSTDRILKVCDVWEDLPTDYRLGYLSAAKDNPNVSNLEYIGEQVVVPIRTSTRTYIAEGLASHNCLKWIIERGMFIDIVKFEHSNGEPALERVLSERRATCVAGIDLGGKGDSTVITIVTVDWDMPVILESRTNEDGVEEFYEAYNTYVIDWHCISNQPDYEEQYAEIVDYLSHFNVVKVVCDATREASVSHRLRANLSCEVIPYIFTARSKSDLYKNLDKEITTGRARVCMGPKTVETREYKEFIEQLGELQKGYSGANLVVSHPDERGAHDDYPDSWALAVWGCASKGEVDNTETAKNNRFTAKTHNERAFTRRVNSVTARRR